MQVEALLQLGRHTDAMQALLVAVERCPQFASMPEYSLMVEHVQKALQATAAAAPQQQEQEQEAQQQKAQART